MRFIIYLLSVLFALAILAYGAIFALSEIKLRDVDSPPTFNRLIPNDELTIEYGRHIARTRGCFGCHGQQLQGKVFTEQWDWVERAVAPNISALAKELDVATLELAIRHGIGRDGRALWSMPSYNWVHLSDDDLAALIAFLRSAPVVEAELPSPSLGLAARLSIAKGDEMHMAQWVNHVPPLRDDLSDPGLKRGEYLAMTACNECHGLDLRGGFGAPDLAIVAAYPLPDFNRLMESGVAMSGRDFLRLMTMVAKDRFAYWTEQEKSDLYHFLRTLANEPVPENVFWRPPG
jgi:mono/diheme cytochrome c family protein